MHRHVKHHCSISLTIIESGVGSIQSLYYSLIMPLIDMSFLLLFLSLLCMVTKCVFLPGLGVGLGNRESGWNRTET